jgi:hypothetical protein
MELKIKFEEMRMLLDTENPEFPKYATQILNLANQNSQATRPKIVGQMSELIKEFTGKTIKEWEEWYLKRYPDSIDKATKKILEMVNNFRDVMSQIDESMIRQWVRDLIIIKTFIGLKFQEAFLKKIAKKFDVDYRLSTPNDESKGIDGYIDNIPVSLKPITYESKKMLSEDLKGYIVYYEKQKDGLKIIIPDELENQLRNIKENNY